MGGQSRAGMGLPLIMDLENTFETKLKETVEELKSLLIEAEFNSRWMLIEAYHSAGKMINEVYSTEGNPLTKEQVVQHIAGKLGKSERTLWYSVKFYEVYPDLNALPEGKNVGWNQVVKKYLTAPKEEDCLHPGDKIIRIEVVKCTECGRTIESRNI